MPKFTDNIKPQFRVYDNLPDVYQSELNRSLFSTAFDRHLSKDDTERVSGWVGQGNPSALRNRQIKETTPHRQAYQLAPSMYTKVGSTETALAFQPFFEQLKLQGIDQDRFAEWGNAVRFNWVPPINIDMLINYADYFWKPQDPNDPAQYITIESKCNKSRSKVNAYANTLAQRGDLFHINNILFLKNSFAIKTKMDDLFVEGFVFYTKNAGNPNLQNHYWTTVTSDYDAESDVTTIEVVEPIAPLSPTPPSNPTINEWWFNTSTNTLMVWSGTAWGAISQKISVDISLSELLSVYQTESNCACSESLGWDIGLWDDNQIGSIVWNQQLLLAISFPTAADWSASNGAVVPLALWYDTTNDRLNQADATMTWVPIIANFSSIVAKTTGTEFWDKTTGCVPQQSNGWTASNHWIHKSEVTSFSGVQRAALPIIEFDSRIELNDWVRDSYSWKYRSDPGTGFSTTSSVPTYLELKPIVGYTATLINNVWTIYLFNNSIPSSSVDLTADFVPGFKFKIVDDGILSDTYTVDAVLLKQVISSDPAEVQGTEFVTVITIHETNFNSPHVGGGANNVRIIPLQTSKGDVWRGYSAHWVLDLQSINTTPSQSMELNPASLVKSNVPIATANGTLYVGLAYQELTIEQQSVQTIALADSLQYQQTRPTYYSTGDNTIRIYINGVRQYGTYKLNFTETTSDIVVGNNTVSGFKVKYVSSVTFNHDLALFDVVRFDVGPAAWKDIGLHEIPVRTIEDENLFVSALAAKTEPQVMTLVRYRKTDQVKSNITQYPLFNIFDVVTGDLIDATSIFAFAESPEYPVNNDVHRRIVRSADGREVEFKQLLTPADDGVLYAYRDSSTLSGPTQAGVPTVWWYNPATKKCLAWTGYVWSSRANVNGAVRSIISQDTPPSTSVLWYQPQTNRVSWWNEALSQWVLLQKPTIGADPSLRTIWQPGTHYEEFVPEYVDASRKPVPLDNPNGSWQIPDQWYFNAEHRNRTNVKYSELLTHFTSIIQAQPKIPGLLGGGIFTLPQSEYNYGLGGTILDHNDSFDTIISSVNVTNSTPLSILSFARDQYSAALLFVRDLFNKHVSDLYGVHTPSAIANQQQTVANGVVAAYEQNAYESQVYGDTSAYDPATGKGVEHWIATTPMFGFAPRVRPGVHKVGNKFELVHHDGHRSEIDLTLAERDGYARMICKMADDRTFSKKAGIISSTLPPSTETEFVANYLNGALGMHLIPGVYWFKQNQNRPLYRLSVIASAETPPSVVDNTGTPWPQGTMYYNYRDAALYVISGGSWNLRTPLGSGDISPAWVIVPLDEHLAVSYATIETKLYEVSPHTGHTIFDDLRLVKNSEDQGIHDQLMHKQFIEFTTRHNIRGIYDNSTYVASDPFTWNYSNSILTIAPTTSSVHFAKAFWKDLYNEWYGTPYPHLEPWKLQGYADKPDWWDAEYKDPSGTRRWLYSHATRVGMWENIRVGRVPAGRLYPSGVVSSGNTSLDNVQLPTYAYFSVNISDTTIRGYDPDAVLPPYFPTSDIEVRSFFVDIVTQIVSPDAGYAFGDGSPVEWEWKTSIGYIYDQLAVAYKMQPIRFMHYGFGIEFTTVNGLQVDALGKRVYAHQNTMFHGDMYDGNKIFEARGLNQWYVNFNRYVGYDTNTEFRTRWVTWRPELTYRFGGIVDTSTVDVTNNYFDVNAQDYNIILANDGVVDDVWSEGFNVSLLSIPPAITQYNNQSKWKLEVSSLAPISRPLTSYSTKSYTFRVDTANSTIKVLSYDVLLIDPTSRRIILAGNHTNRFRYYTRFVLSDASINNGTYTTISSTYNANTDTTEISVLESVSARLSKQGIVDIIGVQVSWDTSDLVVFSATGNLPAPLAINEPYYLVHVSGNTYKVAETFNESLAGVTINFTTGGSGVFTVSQIESSFVILGGSGSTQDVWYHYALDKNDPYVITPPFAFYGMQQLIDFIDGYTAHQQTLGIVYNPSEGVEFDPTNGRAVDWQLELERCINWAYGIRDSRMALNDRYEIKPNTHTSTFTYTDMIPTWSTGTKVMVSTTGTLPSPLIERQPYYVVNGTDGSFKLSVTKFATDVYGIVDITTMGSGTLYISSYSQQNTFPMFEINPQRNSMWIDTEIGVLSNVVSGPYADARVQQTIFDQYGRPLLSDKLTVFRTDKRSHINIRPGLTNDVDVYLSTDPYHHLHFGGAHMFIEGYEHYLLFNDYTASGSLIYDAFLGLSAKKFGLDYFETKNFTLRPTLGGYYLIGQKFERNIEGTIGDIRLAYDAVELPSMNKMAQHARALVGYEGHEDYLDLLNINPKSQFLFYQGMLHTKGSVNSVKGYINNRRFVDAKLDEFWAWKIAEFGDNRPKVYPEIKLFSTDGLKDDVRLELLATSESVLDNDVQADIANGFVPISFNDSSRWNLFPEQKADIVTPLFMNSTVLSVDIIAAQQTPPYNSSAKYWFDGTNTHELVDGHWLPTNRGHLIGGEFVWNTSVINDGVRVMKQTPVTTQHTAPVTSTQQYNVTATIDYRALAGVSVVTLDLGGAVYTCTVASVQPMGQNTVITINEPIPAGSVGILQYVTMDYNNYSSTTLPENGSVDGYRRINAELVAMSTLKLDGIYVIYAVGPSPETNSPARLLDVQSHTVLQNMPVWHPAVGINYQLAMHNIDISQATDPAEYMFTLADPSSRPWLATPVGTRWLDTSTIGYKAYYDDKIYPQINDRLYEWGKLAPWSQPKLYQWVESDVPPTGWDQRVTADQNNNTLVQNDKYTGTPRQTLMKRTRMSYGPVTVTLGSSAEDVTFTVTGSISVGTAVIFAGDKMPTGIIAGTTYKVSQLLSTSPSVFKLVDAEGNPVSVETGVTTPLTLVQSFDELPWTKQHVAVDRLYGIFVTNSTITLNSMFETGDLINVYVNSVPVMVDHVVSARQITIPVVLNEQDIIEVVRPLRNLSPAEIAFDPQVFDDGSQMIQWKYDFEYSIVTTTKGGITTTQQTSTKYYFWVEGRTNRNLQDPASLSIADAITQFIDIPTPYVVVQKPKDDPILIEQYGFGVVGYGKTYSIGDIAEQFYMVPLAYRQVILRKIASYLVDDGRFVAQFTKDMTLRDTLGTYGMNKKDTHEEWLMFRKAQPSSVPQELWNRLTESLIGYKLTNKQIRVPSLERELYDAANNTETQYGLGDDQTFVNAALAKNTILQYLQDPANSFYPANIDDFFRRNTFDTPTGIRLAMSEIYDTFPSSQVNAIWFEVLADALTTKAKYRELMKTSWIALHGIRVLETNGIFDD